MKEPNVCMVCGKMFSRAKGQRSFCSETCADKWAEEVQADMKKIHDKCGKPKGQCRCYWAA